MIKRKLIIIGTGIMTEDSIGLMDFIGTFQEGPLVWHVFIGKDGL